MTKSRQFLRLPSKVRHTRELVLEVIFTGTIGLSLLAFLIVLANFIFLQRTYLSLRLIIILIVIAALVLVYKLPREKYYKRIAYGLVSIYFLGALATVYFWSILTPSGLLLFALVIVLAGILLGSKHSLYVLLLIALSLLVLAYGDVNGLLSPDFTWTSKGANFTDAVQFSVILSILALVSWLFNNGMEQSLRRAEKSERALKRQKALLETTVEQRTRQLKEEQAKKMEQLYRFAELGHISTALLHDLSNHLALLSLDVETLGRARKGRSQLVSQSQKSIEYIENVVNRTRYQLQGQAVIKKFYVAEEISEVVKILDYKARSANVSITWAPNGKQKSYTHYGDAIGFRQLIGNVLANSIDAYERLADNNQVVSIELDKRGSGFVILIRDQGKGIGKPDLEKIFEPFFTTKKQGMGIGLFISKQLAEKEFNGELSVESTRGRGTTFTLVLPRKKRG